jgi:hypothetical protein
MFMAAAADGAGVGVAAAVAAGADAVGAGVEEPAALFGPAFFPQPVKTIAITIMNNKDTENIFLISKKPPILIFCSKRTTHT